MSRVLLWIAVVALLAFGGWRLLGSKSDVEKPTPATEDEPRIGRFPRSQFYLQHDLFLPATDPKAIGAAQAHWLRRDDEVFGVVLDGAPRAYPITMISYHHVVNDVLQGVPIAVTY